MQTILKKYKSFKRIKTFFKVKILQIDAQTNHFKVETKMLKQFQFFYLFVTMRDFNSRYSISASIILSKIIVSSPKVGLWTGFSNQHCLITSYLKETKKIYIQIYQIPKLLDIGGLRYINKKFLDSSSTLNALVLADYSNIVY